MNRLILFRHAKAESGGEDRLRGLTDRGIEDASRMGRALAERGVEPDITLVSSAKRCLHTWQAVAECFPDSEWRSEPELYLASADELFAIAEQTGRQSVMLIAHNPGLHELALSLCPPTHRSAGALLRKFPTSAVAIMDQTEERSWTLHDTLYRAEL